MAARTREAARPRARSDAYVGLLILALLAQIAGAVFLYLDYSAYPPNAPPKIQSAPAPTAPGGPQPAAPQPAAPAGQQMGGGQPQPMQ